MPRRNLVFLVAAGAMAVFCSRLGVWQLHRLAARRAYNHIIASHLADPPVALAALPRDTAQSHFRRVRLDGRYDFAHQIILIDRVRDGAPGVDLVTPLHPGAGMGDTAVLVNRGWVYAADGMTVDTGRWREAAHLSGTGYITALTQAQGPPTSSTRPGLFRWLDRSAVERYVGGPIADYAIVLEPDAPAAAPSSNGPPRTPVRIPPPPLDEGPHLSYAIQWFSFALIAVVGAVYAVFVAPTRDRITVPPLDAPLGHGP